MHRLGPLAVIMLWMGCTPVARPPAPPVDPVGVVRQYVAAQNAHELERMLELVADTLEIRSGLPNEGRPDTVVKRSHDQLRMQFGQAFRSQPTARFQILEVLTEGVIVVTKERAMGLTPDVPDAGISVYRVRNGRIDFLWVITPESLRGG